MRINESCAKCLLEKQQRLTDNEEYLSEIRSIIDSRHESDTAPYLLYLFSRIYERYFGRREPYREIKRSYNDLVLSMEDEIRHRIESDPHPIAAALAAARAGNYIDFGALIDVDGELLLAMLDDAQLEARDMPVYDSFIKQCGDAERFLLIADNCGEIVLDKLLIEQIRRAFPRIQVSVLVRGAEVLNDATPEDAAYVRMDETAKVISSGSSAAGTIYDLLSCEAKEALDHSDVILSKGQGNYESLCGQGRHIFYLFLCKCEPFIERFDVPQLTGLFIEES